jgi:hypothetical protein
MTEPDCPCSYALHEFLRCFVEVEEAQKMRQPAEAWKDAAYLAAYALEEWNPFLHRGRLFEVAWVTAEDGERVPFLRKVNSTPQVLV